MYRYIIMWQHIEVKPGAHILDFYCFQLCFMNWKIMKNCFKKIVFSRQVAAHTHQMFQLVYFSVYKNTAITNTCKIIALRNMCLLQTISAIEAERKQKVDAKK